MRLRWTSCVWCGGEPYDCAEISMTCLSKIPWDAAATHLCYPCITKFLSENSGTHIPELKRQNPPCLGTACIEAVHAIMNHRNGQSTLAPFTRIEFQNEVKKYYGAAPSPVLSRAASPVPGIVLPGPPGMSGMPGSEPTLKEIQVGVRGPPNGIFYPWVRWDRGLADFRRCSRDGVCVFYVFLRFACFS